MLKTKNKVTPMLVVSRGIILICFIFFLVAMARFGVKNLLIDRGYGSDMQLQHMIAFVYGDNPGTEVDRLNRVSVNWAELYPFEKNDNLEKTEKKATIIEAKAEQITQKFENAKGKIVYYFDEALLGKNNILEAGVGLEYAARWNIPQCVQEDAYIFWGGKDGYITACNEEVDVKEGAENLCEFAEWTSEQGIELLYVQYPGKLSGIDKNSMPDGYTTYTDENADALLQLLEDNNVEYLDLRADLMPENADNMFENFFRTDHHWLPQTGLRAAEMIANYLQENGKNVEVDVLEQSRYSVETYEKIFMGSYGREVTEALIEPDDFYLVTPDFETTFEISIPSLQIEKEGTFEETLINKGMLYFRPSYELSQYEVYGWGDRPLIEVKNNATSSDEKVLIIKESFSDVVVPYLAIAVEELAIIDPRHYTGSIRSYIEQYEPDYIIVAYNTGTVAASDNIDYKSRKSLWDFR